MHRLLAALLLCTPALLAYGAADSPYGRAYYDPAEAPFPGVTDMRRAWQNWTLNCQGCHLANGEGSPGSAPRLRASVARFLHAQGGREYLGQVPGVANSPLASAELAEVVNWVLWRFDAQHVPAGFKPYSGEEIAQLRRTPLHTEAKEVRAALLAQPPRHAP